MAVACWALGIRTLVDACSQTTEHTWISAHYQVIIISRTLYVGAHGGPTAKRFLHCLRHLALLALRPVNWTGVNGSGAKHSNRSNVAEPYQQQWKPVIPSLPRHFQRIRRDQEASWVAVSSSVHSGASAGHGQTILQGEVRGDRLQQDQRRTLRGLLPRTEAMLVLRLTLRGVVLALRLALRNPSLQIEQFEARVRFANKFSMSAMRWIRVRKLGLNLRKESTYLRTHYVIAMKQCVKWRSIPTTTEMYQQYISTEAEYMRESLASAARIMSKQPEALADAHLVDEGSTMRIYEDHGAWLSQWACWGWSTTHHPWECGRTATIPLWTRECSSSHTRTAPRRGDGRAVPATTRKTSTRVSWGCRRERGHEPSGDGDHHIKVSRQRRDGHDEQWEPPGDSPECHDDQRSRTCQYAEPDHGVCG